MDIREFWEERKILNEMILKDGNLYTKRFFALDKDVYNEGVIPKKYKEMMGLVASLVLRCDDCITYHIIRCVEEGITKEEFYELINIALVVGGSITIPHVRRAVKTFNRLLENKLPPL